MDCVVRQNGIRYIQPDCVFYILEKLESLKEKGKKWRKRYFVISFLFYTGARVSEAIMVRRRDIRFASKEAVIPTLKKRKKKTGVRDIRVIPLDHVPEKILNHWEQYLSGLEENDKIINMTRQGVHKMVKETFQTFGINSVHPHLLRHSIGIWLATNGVYESVIADFLGHTDTRITSIYTKITGRHLKIMFNNIKKII